MATSNFDLRTAQAKILTGCAIVSINTSTGVLHRKMAKNIDLGYSGQSVRLDFIEPYSVVVPAGTTITNITITDFSVSGGEVIYEVPVNITSPNLDIFYVNMLRLLILD